jgi:hypothetical protein
MLPPPTPLPDGFAAADAPETPLAEPDALGLVMRLVPETFTGWTPVNVPLEGAPDGAAAEDDDEVGPAPPGPPMTVGVQVVKQH